MSNTDQCRYCLCPIHKFIESSSLIHNINDPIIDNPDVIKPCGCEELAHKSCLIYILSTTYKFQCNICSEQYNLSVIDKAKCLFASLFS